MAAPSESAATIGGAAIGQNTLLSIRGYGQRTARTTVFSYGVAITSGEDSAANSRAFYPMDNYIPNYDVTFVFLSIAERDRLSTWLQRYMNKVARNEPVSGYVLVQVPARRTAFNGVPIGDMSFGQTVGEEPHFTLLVRFIGVADPTDGIGNRTAAAKLISRYRGPSRDTTVAPHFYPAGTQKSGMESLEGTLYDPAPPAPRNAPKTTTGGGGGGPVPKMNPW